MNPSSDYEWTRNSGSDIFDDHRTKSRSSWNGITVRARVPSPSLLLINKWSKRNLSLYSVFTTKYINCHRAKFWIRDTWSNLFLILSSSDFLLLLHQLILSCVKRNDKQMKHSARFERSKRDGRIRFCSNAANEIFIFHTETFHTSKCCSLF